MEEDSPRNQLYDSKCQYFVEELDAAAKLAHAKTSCENVLISGLTSSCLTISLNSRYTRFRTVPLEHAIHCHR